MPDPTTLRDWLETEDAEWDRRAAEVARLFLMAGAALGLLVLAMAAGLVPALPWSALAR